MIISQDEIPDKNACGRLIAKLCRAGRTRKAVHVLELLNRYGVTGFHIRTYSVLAKSLCDSGEVDNALKLLRRMQSEEGCVNPDVYMYTIVMNAVFRKGRFEQGMKLLDEMRINGVEPDSITCHTVVNAMCKQGRLDEAIKLVTTSGSSSHGLIPCTESYNAILNILCSADRLVDAAKLLADMCDRRGYSPSAITFRILIRTLCSKSLAYRAITLLESMPEFGCKPDVYHYNPIIACLCRERKMEMVIECLEVMISRGCYPHIVIFNTLLAGLCLHGSADAAVELFNELRASRYCTANLGSYNIMIEGLSRLGRASQALKLLDEARCFRGFKLSKCAVLIVGLISERDIDNAMRILDELKRSRVVVSTYCYNWIIKALCNAGETDRAIDLLVYMVSNGHSLAYASYAAVVEGLASVGLVKEGQELVNELSLRGVVDKGFANGLATKIEKMDRFD
ncbi:Pentatricopeptide repeat-containing protein At1g09900 [Linum grandiflorum]